MVRQRENFLISEEFGSRVAWDSLLLRVSFLHLLNAFSTILFLSLLNFGF